MFQRRASPEPETRAAGTGSPLPEPEPEPEAETGSDVIKPEVGQQISTSPSTLDHHAHTNQCL